MAEGSKRINRIRQDHLVWSRDEHDPDGPLVLQRVEEVFVRQGMVFHLHVGGQVIRTTPEHPYWVQDQGWTAAGELEIGDLLSTEAAGGWVAVEDLLDTGQVETVYNLRVADYHTYFVGSTHWGFSVWVHNSYGKQVAANDWRSISGEAAAYRQRFGIDSVDTNIAVIRYMDRRGNIRHTYGQAQRFMPHAEKQAFNSLPKYVQKDAGKYIKLLYTELSPCPGCVNSMMGIGRSQTMMRIPTSKVRWSFDLNGSRTDFENYVRSLF